MRILSHRGLDFDGSHSFSESSLGAFRYFINSGVGFEFDVQMTSDRRLVVWHDQSLSRLTEGNLDAPFRATQWDEIKRHLTSSDSVCGLDELLALMQSSSDLIFALHLKGPNQDESFIQQLVSKIGDCPEVQSKILIFDVKKQFVSRLRQELPHVNIGLSVAHPYDIERFSRYTAGTLYALEDALSMREAVNWVWLDEWDRRAPGGGTKALYTPEVFLHLKAEGFRTAVVSPELHKTSPGQLGNEAHEDAASLETLINRWYELLSYEPDLICTDYPSRLGKLAVDYSSKDISAR